MDKGTVRRIVLEFLPNVDHARRVSPVFLDKKEFERVTGENGDRCWMVTEGDYFHRLYINLDLSVKASANRMKAAILHEIGHTQHGRDVGLNEGEYMAQMWALGKAYQLIMKEGVGLVAEVRRELLHWECSSDPEYKYVYDRAKMEAII